MWERVLVGGFNPFEKYYMSQIENHFPNFRGENNKSLKPPPVDLDHVGNPSMFVTTIKSPDPQFCQIFSSTISHVLISVLSVYLCIDSMIPLNFGVKEWNFGRFHWFFTDLSCDYSWCFQKSSLCLFFDGWTPSTTMPYSPHTSCFFSWCFFFQKSHS